VHVPVPGQPQHSVGGICIRRRKIPMKAVAAKSGKKYKTGEINIRLVMQQKPAGLMDHQGCAAGNKQVAIEKKAE